MSVTKFENVEGELISQVDINTEKISAKPSQCSCIDCNSIRCFEKRNKAVTDRCQCGFCKDLRNYSTLPNKVSVENKANLDSAKKKVIKEVVTRETIESLKRVTETMYKFGSNENFRLITDKQPKLSDIKAISAPTKSQTSNKIESRQNRPVGEVSSTHVSQAHKEDNTATKLSAQVMNVPYEDLHETVPSSHELTEQNPLSKLNIFKRIKEIYEACSCKVCECISSKPRDLRDDFCNCKPCQCQDCVKTRKKFEEKIRRIPHSGCPCIRCDRKDCRGIAKNTYAAQACDCNLMDSVQYPGNLTKGCKCEPCQCINCTLLGIRTTKSVRLGKVDKFNQESCQCSPCECIECKQIYGRTNPTIMCTHSTDKVIRHNYCRCNTCRTERCLLGESETCKCGRRNRAMRNTANKNYNAYDIRTVIVSNNGPFNQHEECHALKHDTVALFASMKNNYPSNSHVKGVCKCTECECIVCSAKDESLKNYREHLKHIMSVHNNFEEPTWNTNLCKCTPCECEICSRKGEPHNSTEFQSKCRCDECDCINCDNASLVTSSFPNSPFPPSQFPTLPFPTSPFSTSPFPTSSFTPYTPSTPINERHAAKPIRRMDINKNCDCSPCDCSNCKKLFSCSSSVKFYSNGKRIEKKAIKRLRKVTLITPSTSESHLKSRKTHVGSISSLTLSPKHSIGGVFGQDLSTCHAISQAPVCDSRRTNRDQIYHLHQEPQECNVISDDDHDDDKEMFFKLKYPLLDTVSLKSIEDNPVVNYTRTVNQTNAKTHELISQIQDQQNEAENNSFSVIHEKPVKITSNDSDASLPVFWTCCNATSYPRNSSRNIKIICKRTKSNLKDNLSDSLNKTQGTENVENDLLDQGKKESCNQSSNSNDIFKKCDILTEYVEHSFCNKNKTNSCDERINLRQEYTDSVNNSVNPKYRKTVANHSDVTIDYERATRVLWEAKAFSSKLIKMLDSFETANRQFESASQKFKVLHESLLDINASEFDKNHSIKLNRIPRPIFEDNFEVLSQVNFDDRKNTDEREKNENEAEREYEQSTNKAEYTCDNIQYIEELTPTNDTSKIKHIHNCFEDTNDINESKNEINTFNDINVMLNLNAQSQFDNAFNKVEMLSVNNTPGIQVTDDIKFKQVDLNHKLQYKVENKLANIIDTTTSASLVNKFDSVVCNITTVDTAVVTDEEKPYPEFLTQEHKQPWQIFKKNLYLNACPDTQAAIFHSSALESDIKDAIQAISLQTAHENFTQVLRSPNQALTNLQNEVTDLLNMPLLQINSDFKYKTDPDVHLLPRSKLELELKSMSSTASSQTYDQIITKADKEVYFNNNSESDKVSCEHLKANFIGLRRVSDHTVLVKWNVPKRIKDVQGYELLVDGRAVQKIFSPMRSMAVVTCLPHAERVLLTIRTIATADCGHAPATSIVYRPRMK